MAGKFVEEAEVEEVVCKRASEGHLHYGNIEPLWSPVLAVRELGSCGGRGQEMWW